MQPPGAPHPVSGVAGCVARTRPLLLWPQSSHLHRGLDGWPGSQAVLPTGLSSVPWTLSLSPLVALDVKPLWLPCPCPCWLSCCPLSASLPLTTPVSASSLPLGSRLFLPPLSLDPAPARPGSHSDGCKGTRAPALPGPTSPGTLPACPSPVLPSFSRATLSSHLTLCDYGKSPPLWPPFPPCVDDLRRRPAVPRRPLSWGLGSAAEASVALACRAGA